LGTSLGYLLYRKLRHSGSKIKIDGDSFLFKTFLVAASFVSIFSIGTGVQFLNPNAGIDQFLVIFVLVMWLKYSVTDLKQKLDSFLVTEKKEPDKKGSGLDPVVIAQNLVQTRLGETQVKDWYSRAEKKTDYTEVRGVAAIRVGQFHFFTVYVRNDGSILWVEIN